MAYSKHNWLNGEIITAEKLNCIENGLDCVANCSRIWRNENPTAKFPAQEIAIDTTQYNEFEFWFISEVDDAYVNLYVKLNKSRAYGQNGAYSCIVRLGNYERSATIYADRISFSDCTYAVKYNDKLIPYSVHAFV